MTTSPLISTTRLAVRLGPTLLTAVQRNWPVLSVPTLITGSVLYTLVCPTWSHESRESLKLNWIKYTLIQVTVDAGAESVT